jgi:D-beta-D-heptose 7-phosphate kinase/D-beta-D-heptose 1-phosphate adenosyltransferase
MKLERLREQMARGAPPRLWVIGDLMLDRYVVGAVERVSPEAPVPVLRLDHTMDRLGGAANVALNLVTLGGRAALGGMVGADEAGERLVSLLAQAGVGGSGVVRWAGGVTTLKMRALAGAQQLLRIDQERPTPLPIAEIGPLIEGLARDVPEPDVIVLSDYRKGVITAELLDEIRRRAGTAPIFVDPKGLDFSRYAGAALITPNEHEASLASGVEIRDDGSLLAAGEALARAVPGADVLITRGPRGMSLRRRGGEWIHMPARARRVFDVTGAGDSALAALAIARAHQVDWPDALRVANVAAGVAVCKIGAAQVYASELFAGLSHEDSGLKLLDRRGLAELRRTTRLLDQRLVLTNGCFDLLHAGHLRLLQAARALGDVLVVAVNSDASVRRLKGELRPVVGQEDRVALLAGLEAVDFVTEFDEDTPLEVLRACRPDVLVKGDHYAADQVVGGAEVEGWGGQVVRVPILEGRSTTRILERTARSLRAMETAAQADAPRAVHPQRGRGAPT